MGYKEPWSSRRFSHNQHNTNLFRWMRPDGICSPRGIRHSWNSRNVLVQGYFRAGDGPKGFVRARIILPFALNCIPPFYCGQPYEQEKEQQQELSCLEALNIQNSYFLPALSTFKSQLCPEAQDIPPSLSAVSLSFPLGQIVLPSSSAPHAHRLLSRSCIVLLTGPPATSFSHSCPVP